jgi:hypothetical protein
MKYLSEFFEELGKPDVDKEKMILEYVEGHKAQKFALESFVESLYHPMVVFDLPEGQPPFKENKEMIGINKVLDIGGFFKEKRQYYFATISKTKIQDSLKREMFFIRTLESMPRGEANLLLAMKEKDDSNVPGLSEDLIRKIYPNMLPPKK